MRLWNAFCIWDHFCVAMWVVEKTANNRWWHLFCTARWVPYRRPLPWKAGLVWPLENKVMMLSVFLSSGHLPWHWSPALRTCHLETGVRIPEWVWSPGGTELQPWVLPGGPEAGAVPRQRHVERRGGEAQMQRWVTGVLLTSRPSWITDSDGIHLLRDCNLSSYRLTV